MDTKLVNIDEFRQKKAGELVDSAMVSQVMGTSLQSALGKEII